MTKKEKMELLLARVPEEQKTAFVSELREAKTKDAFLAVVSKYKLSLTDEEKKVAESRTNEVSDEELDHAAGGCCLTPNCVICKTNCEIS